MKIKKWNGSSWVQEYPEVNVSSIVATGTPSSSTFLRGDGTWSATFESGLSIGNNSGTTSDSISFATGQTYNGPSIRGQVQDLYRTYYLSSFKIADEGNYASVVPGSWTSLYSSGPTLVTASTSTWTAFALGYTPSSGDIFALRLSYGSTSSSMEKAIVFVEFGTFSSTTGMSVVGFMSYGGVTGTNLIGRNVGAQWQISGSNLQLRYPTYSDWSNTTLNAATTFYVWNIWKVN